MVATLESEAASWKKEKKNESRETRGKPSVDTTTGTQIVHGQTHDGTTFTSAENLDL